MPDPPALVSHGVLVDSDDIPVGQDLDELGPNVAEIIGHDQRGGQRGPDGHLDTRLLIAQAKVANDQLQGKKE